MGKGYERSIALKVWITMYALTQGIYTVEASQDTEVRDDTLFLRDRGIQFIFENSTNLLLRFIGTGNLYPLD